MEKGYYQNYTPPNANGVTVAIHNKNGKGLLLVGSNPAWCTEKIVAIHNKNGKGLLPIFFLSAVLEEKESQSTIKMEKGYYVGTIPAVDTALNRRNPQ